MNNHTAPQLTICKTGFFSTENIEAVSRLFNNELDYRENMNALWKLRSNLSNLMELSPTTSAAIMPQYQVVNELINALITEMRYPIPPYYKHPITGNELLSTPLNLS